MNSKWLRQSVVLPAVLIAAALSVAGLPSRPAAQAQAKAPPAAGSEQLAAPLEVDPFVTKIAAHRDTWISQARPETNYGNELELTVSPDAGAVASALLLFDLAALPDDARVTSATLSVYSTDTEEAQFRVLPDAITSKWAEAEATWNTRPTTANLGDPWARHVPEDWTVFDVTQIVRGWADGSVPKYGIALRADSASTGSRTFQARKTATPPELTVYYTRWTELAAAADTWVGAVQPSTPHDSDPTLSVHAPSHALGEAHALLRFDLEALPDDIEVIGATLSLWSQPNLEALAPAVESTGVLYADAILSQWEDPPATWNSRPASVYLGDPPASFVVVGYTEWDVTGIARSWAGGGLEPHGILLRVAPESSLAFGFWAMDQPHPPKLVIAYGAAPPVCNPITSLDVNGATAAFTGAESIFTAVYFPADADPPDSIRWAATGYAEPLIGPSVTLSWATPGVKTISVEATHCGGTTSTSHTVTVSAPDPECTVPITGVALNGPLLVEVGASHNFLANTNPYNSTPPTTFRWEVTDMPPEEVEVDGRMSQKSLAWPTAGSKTVSVTAQNCGGRAEIHQSVTVVDPAGLPDLVISTAWIDLDEERVYYLVRNQGASAVPPGFGVALSVRGSAAAMTWHPEPLGPGDLDAGYLDYAWSCAGDTADVQLLVDIAEDIQEADESNNQWSDTWNCDQLPPEILSGPLVTEITETRAKVTWTTGEACQDWVEYGTSPYGQPLTKMGSGAYAGMHALILSGLAPGTTYFARAFCQDAAGLTVNSEAVEFETEPPGSTPPLIRSLTVEQHPNGHYEFWQVIVELEDAWYMDRVTCSLDGALFGTDYSADGRGAFPAYTVYLSPCAMGLARQQFFGQAHQLSCTAYRQAPTVLATLEQSVSFIGSPDPPLRLRVVEPSPGRTIHVRGSAVPPGTMLDVLVDAAAYEWRCSASGITDGLPPGVAAVDCDDLTPVTADLIEVWLDGVLKRSVAPFPDILVHPLPVDIGGLVVGDHELRVTAAKGTGTLEMTRTVHVVQQDFPLEVTRSIERAGNKLRVVLDLYNPGRDAIVIHSVQDNIERLQQVNRADSSGDYVVSTGSGSWVVPPIHRRNMVSIDFANPVTLEYDEHYPVDYVVVPILNEVPASAAIGEYAVVVLAGIPPVSPSVSTYYLPGEMVDDPSYGMLPLQDALDNAVARADYVIVTNPGRVFTELAGGLDCGCQAAEVEDLFANMAELASLKNGVLGYLASYGDRAILDDLLEPGSGSWSDKLNPSFSEQDQGYVLIVGETEVVKSHYVGEDHFVTYPKVPDHVHNSDLWYADTAGETARPELVLGRVIGDNLTALNSYLDNIIHAARREPGYGFNRARAYLCNGPGSGWWGIDEQAMQDVMWVLDGAMAFYAYDSTWINFMNDGGAQQKAYHLQYLPDRDLVIYFGHGSEDSWSDGLLSWDVKNGVYDLGSTNPVILAIACNTGNYETEDDSNLAEALLAQGAGFYLGSAEVSEPWSNVDAIFSIMPQWAADQPVGQALNEVKRFIWGLEWAFDNRKLWAFEYNYYGDPKYGRLEGAVQSAPAAAPEEEHVLVTAAPEGLSVRVSLPAPEVTEVAGHDWVEFPGGQVLREPGSYAVPVWQISLDLPARRKVQDVRLVSRGGMEAMGALSLSPVEGVTAAGSWAAPAAAAPTGWFPEMDRVLDWSVEKQPNGNSTLYIMLYPFNYNAESGDAVYYRSYGLTVKTFDTTARIESIDGPSSGKDPGDLVELELVVANSGHPLDLILQPSVRTRGTNKLLGGLPLKTLHDLEGTALAALTWNTRGYEAGDYQVVVELLDTRGHHLDTAVAEVQLGTRDARVTGLTAGQAYFSPGDRIELSMGILNTGTVPIDGEAVFLVQRSGDLALTEMLTATVRTLAPGESVRVPATWDTRGVEDYRYRVQGYLKFVSGATESAELILYRPRVLLPVVMRKR